MHNCIKLILSFHNSFDELLVTEQKSNDLRTKTTFAQADGMVQETPLAEAAILCVSRISSEIAPENLTSVASQAHSVVNAREKGKVSATAGRSMNGRWRTPY